MLVSDTGARCLFGPCVHLNGMSHPEKIDPEFQKSLDYDKVFSYLTVSPKSHVPMGVRRSLVW